MPPIMSEDGVILEGILSVEAALEGKSRTIRLVYADEHKVKTRDRRMLAFLKKLRDAGIPCELCPREVIDEFLSDRVPDAGSTHGGVIAVCSERRYMSYTELLAHTEKQNGYAVLLDGVEDPFNFGYSVRNLYAAGAAGIFLPARNWMSAAGVCARSSAGATELSSLALLPEMKDDGDRLAFVRKVKESGLSIVCAAKTADCVSLYDYEPSFPALLIIGGEKRGISPVFLKEADAIVCIPYHSTASYSLPTASTAAVFGFAWEKYLI